MEFTEKSDGEKTIELMIIWIEKVNWQNCNQQIMLNPMPENIRKKLLNYGTLSVNLNQTKDKKAILLQKISNILER